MKLTKICALLVGVGVAGAVFAAAPHTFAATKTWTGGGGDTNMSTGGNWGGSAPTAGDDLVFPYSASNRTVVNDITANTSFNSITFTGSKTSGLDYAISGNAIELVAGISDTTSDSYAPSPTLSLPIKFTADQTITVSDDGHYITLKGALTGTGNLTISGSGMVSFGDNTADVTNTFTGTITTSAPIIAYGVSSLGSAAGGTVINAGGSVNYTIITTGTAFTIAEPLTVNTAGGVNGALSAIAGFGMDANPNANITFNGAIVLGANTSVYTVGTVTITGPLSGDHTISLASGASGTLVINSSANTSRTPNSSTGAGVATTTTYAENSPSTNIAVGDKNVAIVTGTYGNVTVASGGLLKGTGTINGLIVSSGGTVAPGLSPGCLTVVDYLTIFGTYQVELGGTTACTEYDQISAGGTIGVSNGTLAISLYNGFKPRAGQKFVIINNTGSEAIASTFTGLAEGATFIVDGYTFRISYVGGTGNDVELTVVSVPAAPDTGFALIKSNPIASAGVMVLCAGFIALVARRLAKAPIRSSRRR